MSKCRQEIFSIQDVLEVIDSGDSDFGQSGNSSNESDDDDYIPDTGGNLEVGINNEQESWLLNDTTCDDENDNDDSSSDNSVYDVPIANRLTARKQGKARYRWCKKPFEPPDDHFQGPAVEATDPTGITETPLQYFQRFVTQDMLKLIVEQSNRYSVQKHGKSANISVKELEQVLGIYYKMGLVQMPSLKMYWANETRYPAITDVMSRNRFQFLLGTIHFVDNQIISDEDKKNRLWKIQLFLEMFRQQCLQVTPVQQQSVDEMMVPYKGKFSKIRQYIKGKPHPWGFKIWCRCSVSRLLHDFQVYQGKNENQGKTEFGVGATAVLKMCDNLQKHVNYKIFSDNFFTSFKLIEKMANDGFLYVGTVKQNTLGKLLKSKLLSEKDLSKKGRGSYDYRVESNTNIICLR